MSQQNPFRDAHIAAGFTNPKRAEAAYMKLQAFLKRNVGKVSISGFHFADPSDPKGRFFVCALGEINSINRTQQTITNILKEGEAITFTDEYLYPMREYRNINEKHGIIWREDHL